MAGPGRHVSITLSPASSSADSCSTALTAVPPVQADASPSPPPSKKIRKRPAPTRLPGIRPAKRGGKRGPQQLFGNQPTEQISESSKPEAVQVTCWPAAVRKSYEIMSPFAALEGTPLGKLLMAVPDVTVGGQIIPIPWSAMAAQSQTQKTFGSQISGTQTAVSGNLYGNVYGNGNVNGNGYEYRQGSLVSGGFRGREGEGSASCSSGGVVAPTASWQDSHTCETGRGFVNMSEKGSELAGVGGCENGKGVTVIPTWEERKKLADVEERKREEEEDEEGLLTLSLGLPVSKPRKSVLGDEFPRRKDFFIDANGSNGCFKEEKDFLGYWPIKSMCQIN